MSASGLHLKLQNSILMSNRNEKQRLKAEKTNVGASGLHLKVQKVHFNEQQRSRAERNHCECVWVTFKVAKTPF